ncbi:MAG TPA: chemotaxis protein CheA [Leptospiraceae bacterium]|nr:chemotaxis protein CheA [Leptospiraceae bacterium]HNF12168.1 chemotaxis protein CheA [Leptospiraceae bacterium]HNI96140.1 chemotaxis protein CheA [Leptospiraceae bacterium]HNM04201.1 chemotaxis protein CheA [Leptospiraceae bacterium]HNN03567.1 chemotaxis protein CheA [Leptospiraceae bacterium]
MDSFLNEFISESFEDLKKIESCIVSIENCLNSDIVPDPEMVNTLFRHMHSIKGSSGFFEMKEIVRLAHQAETVLDLFRKESLAITSDRLDLVLKARDQIQFLFESVEKNGSDRGSEEITDSVILELKELEKFSEEKKQKKELKRFGLFSDPVSQSDEEIIIKKEEKFGFFTESDSDVQEKNSEDSEGNSKTAAEKKQKTVVSAQSRQNENTGFHDETRDIRIGTDKLDSLIDMLGELVIADAMVHRHSYSEILNVELLRKSVSQLNKITRYLQDLGLSMRMIPVAGLFKKMTRIVRDLAKKSGKNVRLETKGEETELDKIIIEQLSDPLLHIMRNAIDHGLETKEERESLGKDAVCIISLEAMHKGNEIWITVSDDGRGLNRTRILAKAREMNLTDEDENSMSDSEVWDLIFHPGFSTAEKLTDLSGRGVGMDVVRKNIQRLKGRIDVQSIQGSGTTFFLRIPLTLAIIDAMIVMYSGRYYVIPTENIDRFIDLNTIVPSDLHGKQKVLDINGNLIPLVDLNLVFDYRESGEETGSRIAAVVGIEGRFAALQLDSIIGSQQVVVKHLPESMEHLQGVFGTAILGDGEVGLILDAEFIIKKYSTNKIQSAQI